MTEPVVRHILGISGGKDSAALAVHMKERHPQMPMEYFFCDTGFELKETYEYLVRLEAFLGKPISRLNSERDFKYWLKVYGGYLPSSNMRWCTRQLKLRPMEQWIGDDAVISYVAIRADEDREGYISTKPNIKAVFPFRDENLNKADVFAILERAGLGVPKYYEWRSRSGCSFCFFQRRAEWVALRERHPDLFEQAKAFEKPGPSGEPGYTWVQGESLSDLEQPERIAEIKERHAVALAREAKRQKSSRLMDILSDVLDDENDEQACAICSI